MLSTGIACETFYNRMCRCAFYKEKDLYLKQISLFFEKLITKKIDKTNFLKIFSDEINRKAFTGSRFIPVDDVQYIKNFYIKCATNLNSIIKKFNIVEYNEKYVYKYKLKGKVSAIIDNHGKKTNLYFCYKNAIDTQKLLDFYELNNYFYNESKGTTNNMIVVSIPTNMFFSIDYNSSNYTIPRGFISIIQSSRIKKCGEYCLNCLNSCKPTITNGIKRMELVI